MSFYRNEPEIDPFGPEGEFLNRAEPDRSHAGTQVVGCDCHYCEDTREYLRVCMDAMAAHLNKSLAERSTWAESVDRNDAPSVIRCDHCDHWIVDGHEDNGRIGKDYVCAMCFNNHPAVVEGRMRELRADTRRK